MTDGETNMQAKCRTATCRSCRRTGLEPVLDLGAMPLSDGLLTESQLTESEGRYPLEVAFCPDCTLVQILETVPPETLFCEDYPYYSSFSDALLAHSRENALELMSSRGLTSGANELRVAGSVSGPPRALLGATGGLVRGLSGIGLRQAISGSR